MDLPLRGRFLWIADNLCILASLLWQLLWNVLHIKKDKKTAEPGDIQVALLTVEEDQEEGLSYNTLFSQ